MYVGEVNSEGYAEWKAVIKDEEYDFKQIQADFHFNLEEYYKSHNNQLKYIPIGFEANGLLIVVNNDTGKVYIEDHERESYMEIANSINN
jgi:hypothetical protein